MVNNTQHLFEIVTFVYKQDGGLPGQSNTMDNALRLVSNKL